MDELAEKLGLDPVEFRLKNVVQEGDRMPNGVMYPRIGCKEVEEAMKAHPHYNTPLEEPTVAGRRRGRGLAVAHRFNSGQMSSAAIHVNSNGTINLITGSVDLSGSRVSIAMQAAEALALRAEEVNPIVVDRGRHRCERIHRWLRRQPDHLRHRPGGHCRR